MLLGSPFIRQRSGQSEPQATKDVTIDIELKTSAVLKCDEESGDSVVQCEPNALPLLSSNFIATSRTMEKLKQSREIVEGNRFIGLAAFLTVLTLACDDIQVLEVSQLLDVVLLFSIVVFGFEFVVLCGAKDQYCWSAWFFIDFFALSTLVMDLPIFEQIALSENSKTATFEETATEDGGIAAHAIRIARALRILTRVAKLYKLSLTFLPCMWVPSSSSLSSSRFPCQSLCHLFSKRTPELHSGTPVDWIPLATPR